MCLSEWVLGRVLRHVSCGWGADGLMVIILKIPEEEVIDSIFFSSVLALEMCDIVSRDLSPLLDITLKLLTLLSCLGFMSFGMGNCIFIHFCH